MPKTFQQFGTEIGSTVERKNAAYGSSFATAGPALRLLFPQGIPAARLDDALLLARMWDKMQRIATDRDAFGESPFLDLAGYAILGAHMHQSQEEPCVTANDAPRPSPETAPASSASFAAHDAPAPTTTIASAQSEPSSPLPSPQRLSDESQAVGASVPTAKALAQGADLGDVLQRCADRSARARCSNCNELTRFGLKLSAHHQPIYVCSHACCDMLRDAFNHRNPGTAA